MHAHIDIGATEGLRPPRGFSWGPMDAARRR